MRATQLLSYVYDKRKPADVTFSHITITKELKSARGKFKSYRKVWLKAKKRIKKKLFKNQNYILKKDILV